VASGLLSYINKNLKSKKGFFYYRGKYRTLSCSFNEVYDYAARFSELLKELKLKHGDRVIIKGQNRPEWIIAYLGCLMAGVVAVPLDQKSGYDFERRVQKKVNAKLKIYSGNENRSSKLRSISMKGIREILESVQPLEHKDEAVDDDDLAQVIFTSGTTAEPKGVMITHRNIEANLRSVEPVMDRWKNFFRLMWNLKILSVVPLSHMYGQFIGIYVPMMIGSSVVFTDSTSPRDIVKAIREEKTWILGTLPKILELLKEYIVKKLNLEGKKFERKYDRFKRIKWPIRLIAFLNIHLKIGWRLVAIIVGGAAFDKSLDEFWRCIAYTIFQGYGLTETAPLITLADPSLTGAGSIGRVLDGQKVRLVNGEIYVKGDNVTPGYYKDTGSTVEALSRGWFRTGDLAEMGKDGNLYFKGRKDEVIVRADGINIYPEDIESALKKLGKVKDCVVLGLKYRGSLDIHAVLILEGKYRVSPEKIISDANKKLNVYQHINSFSIWRGNDFPRTATKKVKRSEVLKAVLKAGTRGQTAGKQTERDWQGIFKIISSFHSIGSHDLKKKAELETDLGLDSLGMVRLVSEIEQEYDIEVDDSKITGRTTVEEIENMIRNPRGASQRIPFYSFPFWTPIRLLRTIFQYILYPFILLIYRPKVEGRENIKGMRQPFVFASNHTSLLDTFAVLYSLPLRLRYNVTTVMSIEYHFNHYFYHKGPWWRRIIEAVGFYLLVNLFIITCPLSRTHGFKQIMENIGKVISRGWHILIYPEGRVTTDGSIKEFESGVGIIASDMEIPVVPVRIRGLFNILRNGVLPWGHMPRRPLVEVSFGKPIKFKNKSYREITRIIEKKVKSM
jgi:long-chain acyl-CoA synthetase